MRFVTKCLLVTFFVLYLLCLFTRMRKQLSSSFMAFGPFSGNGLSSSSFNILHSLAHSLPFQHLQQLHDIPPTSNSPTTP